jgi:hypothetical protein
MSSIPVNVVCTVHIFRPGHSQQNEQQIWSSPLTEIRFVGCVWVNQTKGQLLPLPHYILPYFSSYTAQRQGVKIWPLPVYFSMTERYHSVSGPQRSFHTRKTAQ